MNYNIYKWWIKNNGIDYVVSKKERSVNMKKINKMKKFYDSIKDCKKCPYGEKRNKFVFGEGNEDADIIFIGEGPGKDEDLKGRPFVGRAGKLLRKIIKEENLNMNKVYIANITKCRPFGNEDPRKEAVNSCLPYLEKQIEIIEPNIIATLGRVPGRILTSRKNLKITKEHGQIDKFFNTPVLLMYHPSYLLRNRGGKRMREFRNDLNKLKKYIGK